MKRDGRCVISIQSAVEYFYYKTASGKLISGDKEYKKQTRYNMELVYIQDIDMLDNAGIGSAVGTTVRIAVLRSEVLEQRNVNIVAHMLSLSI